jgi:photosystem II stability/assembly factor-like uncharacterized protein
MVLLLDGCMPSPDASDLTMTAQESGTSARLIGLHPVNERVVWASGTGGTYVRTTDGGQAWTSGTVPGADSLQFRDVHAVSPDTAYLLSIGRGAQSRIYKTTDGGTSWTRKFTSPEPEAFFDCMDFWDAEHGIAFSDAIDGTFYLVTTRDGGETWRRVSPGALPPAADGEASFAASGTCLVTQGDSTAYVGTGAVDTARVLRTTDRGRTWTAHATPIAAGKPVAGIASLTFRTSQHGAALGGVMAVDDLPDSTVANVALTSDGGDSWTSAPSAPRPKGGSSLRAAPLPGVFGGTYVPGLDPAPLVVVGPAGIAYSLDDGEHWTTATDQSHWSVAFVGSRAGWAVGPDGRITKLAFE